MLKSLLYLPLLLLFFIEANGQGYYTTDPDSLDKIIVNSGLNQTYEYKGEYFSNLQSLSYELNKVKDADVSMYYEKYIVNRAFSRAFGLTSAGLIGYSFATYIFGDEGNSLNGRLIAGGAAALGVSYVFSRIAAKHGRKAIKRYNNIYNDRSRLSLYHLPTEQGSTGLTWNFKF